MTKPLISIIVPVYNVEQYLERCVKSIQNQTYKNLEIVLVNDGSPDNCGAMCDDFAKTDSRIKVVHKVNGGLSDARNAGLDIINGEYVGFVDSDDWIEAEMYETLYENLAKHDAKISIGGMAIEYPQSTRKWNRFSCDNDDTEVLSTKEALLELTRQFKVSNSVCDKLFHKSIFENIRMTKGIVNEDMEIMHLCIEKSERIAYCHKTLYHYIMREESITHDSFSEIKFTQSNMTRLRMDYYQKKYSDIYPYAVAGHISICLDLIWQSAKIPTCSKHRKLLIKEVRKLSSVKIMSLLPKKRQIELILFLIAPCLHAKVMMTHHSNKHKGEQ